LHKQQGGTSFSSRSLSSNRILQFNQDVSGHQNYRDSFEADGAQFELFTDPIPDHAIVSFDVKGRVLRWSHGAERIMGWRAEDILGQPVDALYTPEDVAKGTPQREREEASQKGHVHEEGWHLRRDGSRFWASGSLSAVRNQAGELVAFTKVMRDLTERNQAEERLRESEERLRLFIENVTDYALLQVDTAARISSWNTGAARTFGYTEEEILGQPMRTLYVPEDAAKGDAEADLDLARQNGRFEDARWLVRKDGSRFFGRWVTTPMWDQAGNLRGYAKVLRDETERRKAEQQMRASLAEKQALLQEIHHRVKNNLQVVTSLLSIQAARINNPELSAVLADTENRVRAIAALHESLYSSQDLSSIEFGSYVQHLVRDLAGFFGVDRNRVQVVVNSVDLVVDIGQAIPLGLILNELVTNAVKHAFPNARAGTLEIQLTYVPDSVDIEKGQTLDQGLARLTVRDDGIGLPPNFKFDETPSMGLHLVNVLVRQLQGELEVASTRGTSVTIKFPLSRTLAKFHEDGSNSYR
jgi:PAS domain S-box-containing protein